MDLFPLGTLVAAESYGTIGGVSYNFFEPNDKCKSFVTATSLVTRFQNQTILARKKAEQYLTINYSYRNIFSTEFDQIQHFLENKDEAVNSFYVVDLAKGVLPSAIDTSTTWIASIANTRLYSATTNLKSNYVFFYNGLVWKVGTITTVTTNTSVTCDVDTNNFGTMTDALGSVVTGRRPTMIYPIYQCFAVPGVLATFDVTEWWPNVDTDRGYMWSGNISFTSKYSV